MESKHKGAAKVITSLWKKLDVVVGQLKYHTFVAETKVPRVKAQRTNRRGVCGTFQIAKRVASNLHSPLNHSTNLNPLFDKQEVVLISERNDVENQHVLPTTATKTDSWRAPSMQPTTSANQMPSSKSRTNYGVGVHGVLTVQQETGSSESQNNADSPGINVSSLQPMQGQSNDQRTSQLPNTSGSSQIENNFRQDFSKVMASQESNHSKTKTNKQSLGPDSRVNTCTCPESYEPTDTIMPNSECTLAPSIEIVKERSSPSLMSDAGNISNIRNLLQLGGRNYEACDMDNTSNKIELLSKSPKRKGHSPKKRHCSNPSPSKIIPIDPNPGASQPSENTLEFQQLFDDSNLDTTMPLLLDTLLSTPLLPEKLAENINKVCCTKQNEATTEVVSESCQVSSRNNDASILQDETQVPVDDILNLMEADPAFDAFFNLLSTDGVKKLSPCKESQTATTFSLEPVSTSAVCCSTEPVSTGNGSSVQHPASSDSNIPTTSVVTESLLLLASSPSKCPSSTSITPTLESLHVVSPKEVTPEITHKESTTCVKEASVRASGSSGPVHVRSLQFQDKQSVAPFGKPKKSKPGRKKHNSTKTSVRVGKQRLKKLNRENSNGQGDKLRFLTENGPGALTVVPSSFSTIDVSAVKLLQSFASVHSNGNGSNGNGVGMKKTQGGTSVQFLQDAAIHQQVQGPSTLCESQRDYDAKIAGLSLNTSLGQGLMRNTLQPTVQKNVTFQSLLLNELGTSNNVNGVTMSQQTVLPSWTSSTPLINQQGVRQLLPRPSVHAQICSTPLLSALVKASPTKSCIQLISTIQSSSLAPYVPSSSVSSPSFSSVTIPSTESPLFESLATSFVTSSSSSSSTFHSSSPTFVSSTPLNHLSLSSASSSPSSSRLDHLSSAVTAIPPSLPYSLREPSLLPPPLSSVLMPQSSLQSLPSCVSSSSSSSSMFSPSQGLHASCLPAHLHQQEDYHSSSQQHSQFKLTHTATDLQRSTTFDQNPSTNLQTIEQEDRKQMDRAMAIDKLSGSLAKTKTVFQEPQIIDSGEPNPTSQNIEKCVSGFTSGFKDFLGDKQTNYQGSCILLKNDTSEPVKNIPQDKGIDSGLSRMPRKVTCSGQRENTHINEFIRSENNSSGLCEWERVSEPNDNIKMIKHSDRQDSCIEDRQHGQKRPADQHIKENKPKKSKRCKKSKKSKTKLLPKDFDVEKFLARLHYVEK